MIDSDTTESVPDHEINGAELLDQIKTWFGRYISVTDDEDLAILALWTAHTHAVNELYTTPRLLIDSLVPASGKTTVLDHLSRLCAHAVQAAHLSSAALPRLLEGGMRTILLDEADRMLNPNRSSTNDLLAILNSGYRSGATRPVLVKVGSDWRPKEMPTYAPVAIAGNSAELPADTMSRSIRILLLPDSGGAVEDSDWEMINDDASKLCLDTAAWVDSVREQLKKLSVELPEACTGRAKEKWRPLKRVAVAAGGDWPAVVDRLIVRSLADDEAERDVGLHLLPPGMVLLSDLHSVWPESEPFVPSRDLRARVLRQNPNCWGLASSYGKPLTAQRFGQLLVQAAKVTSSRPGGGGSPRGYLRSQLEPIWRRLGLRQNTSGAIDDSGESDPTSITRWENRLHPLPGTTTGTPTQAD